MRHAGLTNTEPPAAYRGRSFQRPACRFGSRAPYRVWTQSQALCAPCPKLASALIDPPAPGHASASRRDHVRRRSRKLTNCMMRGVRRGESCIRAGGPAGLLLTVGWAESTDHPGTQRAAQSARRPPSPVRRRTLTDPHGCFARTTTALLARRYSRRPCRRTLLPSNPIVPRSGLSRSLLGDSASPRAMLTICGRRLL